MDMNVVRDIHTAVETRENGPVTSGMLTSEFERSMEIIKREIRNVKAEQALLFYEGWYIEVEVEYIVTTDKGILKNKGAHLQLKGDYTHPSILCADVLGESVAIYAINKSKKKHPLHRIISTKLGLSRNLKQ